MIVHVCNDIGGWGAGFVVAISRRWKAPEEAYRKWHAGKGEHPLFELGQVLFVDVADGLVVATSDKQRFAFSEDRTRIRANQGHSVEVDLQYEPRTPPAVLYHGTATRFLDSIRSQGLLKMERHHVHLSAETRVTIQVGARHGKPALLTIRAGDMAAVGHVFYCSTNGVWLVDAVPVPFIDFPE